MHESEKYSWHNSFFGPSDYDLCAEYETVLFSYKLKDVYVVTLQYAHGFLI